MTVLVAMVDCCDKWRKRVYTGLEVTTLVVVALLIKTARETNSGLIQHIVLDAAPEYFL